MKSRVKGLNQVLLQRLKIYAALGFMSDSAESELQGTGKRHKNGAVSGSIWGHRLLPIKEQVQKATILVPLLYCHPLNSEKGY